MDRFEDMRVYLQVAEVQSVTRAAETLNLAPSAVSRRIKDLETRLGAQLLIRTTRRMSLTEAGEAYRRRCQQILSDLEEAEAEVADRMRRLTGPLRIAGPLSFGTRHLGPVVAAFLAQHPAVTVELDLSDRQVDLVGEGFDLALRIGTLSDSSLMARKLMEVQRLAVAAPDFVAAQGPVETPEALRTLPCLCYAGSERADIWRFTGPEGEGSVQVPIRMRANNGDVLMAAVEAGLGVAVQPTFIAEASLRAGRVVRILPAHSFETVTIHLVYPEARHLSAKTRAFMDFARAEFGREAPWERGLPGL